MLGTAETNDQGAERCAELGAILGLTEPVPPAVLSAALRDPIYAQNLLVSRGERRFLDRLLANPPQPEPDSGPAAGTLMANAAVSLARWAMTGFSTVSDEIYAARIAACGACPYLRRPPENRRLLYAAAGARGDDRGVCAKCGCVIAVKARRPRDTCPDAHPVEEGVNRWGDPHRPPP